MIITGHIVVTPNEAEPYKLVLEHEDGSVEERPVSSIKEGEAFIRDHIPPQPPDEAAEWQVPKPRI